MNEVKKNWANPEQYAEAKKVLEAQNLDVKNEYLYVQVLTAMGYDTFMGDIKNWIKASNVTVDVSGIISKQTA